MEEYVNKALTKSGISHRTVSGLLPIVILPRLHFHIQGMGISEDGTVLYCPGFRLFECGTLPHTKTLFSFHFRSLIFWDLYLSALLEQQRVIPKGTPQMRILVIRIKSVLES